MAKKIRGVMLEENLDNTMGLEFFNLSHRFGYQSPNWPYFEDVKIERIHYMAKSGVLSQRITTSMHNTTHIDAPAHVVQGTPFIDEVPLPHFFGSGIVISIPKKKWEQITYDDLEKAAGKIVRPRDVVIVNTGWHKLYEDSEDYFCRAPGFVPSAGEWFVEKKVKVVGHDTQANDHPLATAIGPQRNGPLHPHLAEEYKKWSGGRDWKDDFPEWEPVHRILFKNGILGIENVGGDIDKVTGTALHLRVLSLELGPRRRLHHPARRHRRPEGRLPDREGGEVLMQVKRFAEAKSYEAPNHRDYQLAAPVRRRSRRHADAGRSGVSHFLPGGGAGPDASPPEKIYFVLEGELTVIVGGKETVAEEERFLRDRAEREPRDHQSRQRGVHDLRRGRAGEVKQFAMSPLRHRGEVAAQRPSKERWPRRLGASRPSRLASLATSAVSGVHDERVSIHVRRFSEKPALAVRCQRQDRDRHRGIRRVRSARREGSCRRGRQRRGLGWQCGGAQEGGRRMRKPRRQGRGGRQAHQQRGELRRHRQGGRRQIWPRRHSGVRIRPQQSVEDRRPEGRRLPRRHGCQCHAVVADGARGRQADAQAGKGGHRAAR